MKKKPSLPSGKFFANEGKTFEPKLSGGRTDSGEPMKDSSIQDDAQFIKEVLDEWAKKNKYEDWAEVEGMCTDMDWDLTEDVVRFAISATRNRNRMVECEMCRKTTLAEGYENGREDANNQWAKTHEILIAVAEKKARLAEAKEIFAELDKELYCAKEVVSSLRVIRLREYERIKAKRLRGE